MRFASFVLGSLLASATACSSDSPSANPAAGSGGSPAIGGSTSGGAPPATGGTQSTTGGMRPTSGGTIATPTGGTAGSPATGGTGALTGGSAGMGGTSAGSGGAAGGAGTPAGGGAGGGAAKTGFLSEDFEAQTVGQQPTGWDNFVAWNKNGMNPSGDTLALVDETRAHGGKRSMHFHGGQNPAMITKTLPTGTNKLYVRAYFWMSRQLGMNPGANHETLIGIRGTTGGASDEVRFGEIKGVIGTNEVPSDNISPKMDLWGKGPVIPANAWACIEVAFLADQANHTLHAWHDGTLVHEVTSGDQWQNGSMPATWLNGKFLEVIVGWHSFSSNTIDVWMDDLVLSTSPVGCN